MGEEKKEEEKVSRRKYLGAVGGLAAATAIGWGLAGYLASRPPAPAVERTVTVTKTVTVTPAVTPTPTPTPTPAKKYEGVSLVCALIGGGAYETLYEKIPTWEEQTGATVDSSTRMAHFDLNKKLDLVFASGHVPYDVISTHNAFYMAWVPYLEPLDNYIDTIIPKEQIEGYSKPYLEMLRYEGKLWALPRTQCDIRLVYYRTDLFNDPKEQENFYSKYGYDLRPPQNWDEWLDVAEFFTRPPDLYGFVFAGREEALSGTIYEATLSAGGDFFDENWKPIFNEDPGIKALTQFVKLYKYSPPGCINYMWDAVNDAFCSGKVAHSCDWQGWYQVVKNSSVGNRFSQAPYPVGPGGIRALWTGVHSLSVTKASKHKEAAVDLIAFLTNKENAYYESKTTGNIPASVWALSKVLEDVEKSGNELDILHWKLIQDALNEKPPYMLRPAPKTPLWEKISDAFWPEAQKAILGKKSVEAALNDAAKKVYEILEKAGYYK